MKRYDTDVYMRGELWGQFAHGDTLESALENLARDICMEYGVTMDEIYIESFDYDYSVGNMVMINDGKSFYSRDFHNQTQMS